MKIALFGGSFDPIHKEHMRCVQAAARVFDKIIVTPSYIAPHKGEGAVASGGDRLEMCKIAFRDMPVVQVSDFEISRGETSYSYLTCKKFAAEYPEAERYFLMGGDMLEDFFTWKNPREILAVTTLAVCGREREISPSLREKFESAFGRTFRVIEYVGGRVSSTELRVALAFGKSPEELDEETLRYIRRKGLYAHPAIEPALMLETPARREHSYRVAKTACLRARSLKIPERKALLAAALHDCGKYVPLSSPLLKGFLPPEGVPEPVMHQFTGAYIAEHTFEIEDEEILGAIRYHTSGKEDMNALEKLIFLADLLEEDRNFPGVEGLRELFWRDLDECLYQSLTLNVDYLHRSGKTVYPLTEKALTWLKSARNR